MTDKQNSTDTPEENQLLSNLETFAEKPPAAKTIQFTEFPPKDYDTNLIDDFLDIVFHADMDDDESILTWSVKPTRSPAYPKSDSQLLDTLEKSRQAKALYFATATCKPDTDGKLYHRKKLFKSLRVVVLDDIGTKVPVEKIPESFPPSYIIESSAGNFQYGYVLDEPVRDLAAAEALIQLVYESGYSDEGGKTPVKLVRLPEGVNGKAGEKGQFVTRITEISDRQYSPQQILDELELNVNWGDVLENALEVTKRRASRSLGSTPWADITPQAQALNGYIDPVLEWLYSEKQVTMDNGGEWVEIKCPWSDSHTTGKDTAGYAPLGRGEDVNTRGFKCFHEHCTGHNTVEFLKYVAVNTGIQAGVRDPAAKLATQYVFDKMANVAWDIKSSKRDLNIPMQGFRALYPHKTTVQTVDGKEKLVGMTDLWLTSPSRVVVTGTTYDPSTTARIVEQKGEKFVNLFNVPEWGTGPIDTKHVEKFNSYLKYLIPEKECRDYFLHWLAAKIQDMSFRGAAIVMVAHKQGVGRSTLADMMKTLMGDSNAADVPLNDMISGSQFNEWMEKPFIVSEETLTGDPSKFYNTYEKLKTFIDPRSRTITINPKFGRKREVDIHASYLFLTNHENAIAIPEEDRRFYVLHNAHTPAEPQFFMDLNAWLGLNDSDGMPLWARHVYRWLQTVDVDLPLLLAPPPKTASKESMVNAATNDLDFATKVALNNWPDPYVVANELYKVFSQPVLAGPLHFDEETNIKYVKNLVMKNSTAYPLASSIRTPLGKVRPRLLDSHKKKPHIAMKDKQAGIKLADHFKHGRLHVDYAKIADKVLEAMQEDDRL